MLILKKYFVQKNMKNVKKNVIRIYFVVLIDLMHREKLWQFFTQNGDFSAQNSPVILTHMLVKCIRAGSLFAYLILH